MGKPKLLSAAEILAADDLQTERVSVPAWGGDVLVKGLSLAEHSRIKREASDEEGMLDEEKMQALILVTALVDEAGAPAFTHEQAEALAQKSVTACGVVMKAIARSSGLSEADLRRAERTFRAGA